MKAVITAVLFGAANLLTPAVAAEKPVAIVIHGGAGTILKENFTPELEQAYKAKLAEAASTGYAFLEKGEPGDIPADEVNRAMDLARGSWASGR